MDPKILAEEAEQQTTSIGTQIVVYVGTAIAVGLNLTPGVLFYELYKGKRVFSSIPQMMFVTGVFCCSTNLAYGIIERDFNLILSNTICDLVQVFYATIFLYLFSGKKFLMFVLYTFMAWNLTLEVVYIFSNVIEYHTSREIASNFTGWFNVVIGVINAGAPGQNIIRVFKENNFTLIPIVTTFFQCACSSLWGVYGLFKLDLKIIVPNVLGVLLTAAQIYAYYYVYFKTGGVAPKIEENDEEEKHDDIENPNLEDSGDSDSNKIRLVDQN